MPPSVILRVRVTPRGGRDTIIGYRSSDKTLLLRVHAPPVDGAANRACIGLIAESLSFRRSQVTLIGGETSREKRFAISDITDVELQKRLLNLKQCDQELGEQP